MKVVTLATSAWLRSRSSRARRTSPSSDRPAIGIELEDGGDLRSRIYEKLRLRTRADLVHYAMVVGLLDESPGESL
jgi:hypothetical protein